MLIRDLLDKYLQLGHNLRNAQNLAAEEIILTKIATSPLSEHITLKGGIVMYNLTKNNRRVTQDIDFDLIRYSIDEESIKTFIKKLNTVKDDLTIFIDREMEELHQEDYRGVRVHLLIKDTKQKQLKIKLDIGVHTYSAIEQEKILFSFENNDESITLKVNPTEQIFAEKLLSLARLGSLSTRYKDIYDLYYLIDNNLLKIQKVREVLSLFFESSKRKPDDFNELVAAIESTLNSTSFAKEAHKPASQWIDVDYSTVKESIINYICKL